MSNGTRSKRSLPQPAVMTGCCTPLAADRFGPNEAKALADRFKAVADPTRLRLLGLIGQNPEGACVCDLVDALDRSQPTISHHLKTLVEAGLLHREQRGRWAWFTVDAAAVDELRGALG